MGDKQDTNYVIEFRPIKILLERRKKAREMGRLIYPEPILANIKRRKFYKILTKARTPGGIILNRACDFLINVGKILRDPATWESAVASEIVGIAISKLFKLK